MASSEPTENARYEKDKIDGNNLNLDSYCLADSFFSWLMNSSDPNILMNTDFIYSMAYDKIGKCLIFNHTAYDPKLRLLPRSCGDRDAKRLNDMFQALGFEAEIFKNHTYDEAMDELLNASKADFDNYGCFMCCITTHGDCNGKLYAYDKKYDINEVWRLFCSDKCPSLAKKPKIFIIQACRGDDPNYGYKVFFREATDSKTESGAGDESELRNVENFGYPHYFFPSTPIYSDFLTAYSTYDGFYSFKNKCGSYFITSFCEALKKYHKELDLVSILTLVNHEIAYKFRSNCEDPSQDKLKQMPCFDSSLTKWIKFS